MAKKQFFAMTDNDSRKGAEAQSFYDKKRTENEELRVTFSLFRVSFAP